MKPPELPPGFGLRWQAKRDTALGEDVPNIQRPAELESAVAAALCRRSPKSQRLKVDTGGYGESKLKEMKWN
jgi:hypothetical protein